jgi:Ion channel
MPVLFLGVSRLYDIFLKWVRKQWYRLRRQCGFAADNISQFRETLATVLLAVMMFTIILFLTAGVYSAVEDLNFEDACWFSFVSLTTIGFGDISPVTQTGRGLFLLFGMLGVVANSYIISQVTQNTSSRYSQLFAQRRARVRKLLKVGEMSASDADEQLDEDEGLGAVLELRDNIEAIVAEGSRVERDALRTMLQEQLESIAGDL